MRIVVGIITIVMSLGIYHVDASEGGSGKLNHLAGEKSPYLIQHATNPVDWYPWGEAAFAKAKRENKPIFLSIGYSTCHWCHVMERESFTDAKVAAFLNAHFVSIKVDREERPDVDKIYMTAYQAMYGGGGGWPLNMFLTPELKPFAGGTYFPPESRQGRPSFLNVLKTLSAAWNGQGVEVVKSANDLHAQMQRVLAQKVADAHAVRVEHLGLASKSMVSNVDEVHGGWGDGPKFPQSSHLRFLLRQWQRTGDAKALEVVLMTCDKMMQGGIHDHLAGGFHRYTVDGQWLVPHFEKMLYDQAQLLDLYLDVWLISGDVRYRDVALGISEYVVREMQHTENGQLGGFYSAQDAQSEGKEGKCFLWTYEELSKLLTGDEFRLVQRWFGITKEGNFIDHSDPAPLPNQNVLHLVDPSWKLTSDERVTLDVALLKMKAARELRVPAATDQKVLADWNGMMIASLARAGRVLNQPKFLESAVQAHRFIKVQLWDGKVLYHRWCDGARDSSHQASSYLQMIAGSLGLYEATLNPEYLEFAIQLAEGARQLFYDEKNGGFYLGTQRADLVLRLKDDYDGATPTASSVGAMEFWKLAKITGRKDFRELADKTLGAHSGTITKSPHSMAWMLCVADSALGESKRLVIADGKGLDALVSALYQQYVPRLVIMGNRGAVDDFSRNLKAVDGKATAYYCEGKACQAPVNESMQLRALLKFEQKPVKK